MIIEAKPLSPTLFKCVRFLLKRLLNKRFNKLIIRPVPIQSHQSYLLMCNHFSFWDGFLAYYLISEILWKQDQVQKVYIMSLKKQMEKNRWLKYFGSFSVDPGKRSVKDSFDYASKVLSTPGNLLLFFPQGKLESISVQVIEFQEGLREIVPKIDGTCQMIWSSNLIEYFESMKPSVYFNMLDCGNNHSFNFSRMKDQVNVHHRAAMLKNIRFTKQ